LIVLNFNVFVIFIGTNVSRKFRWFCKSFRYIYLTSLQILNIDHSLIEKLKGIDFSFALMFVCLFDGA
jgi:uncharacterized protein YggT (Ycf19 family)